MEARRGVHAALTVYDMLGGDKACHQRGRAAPQESGAQRRVDAGKADPPSACPGRSEPLPLTRARARRSSIASRAPAGTPPRSPRAPGGLCGREPAPQNESVCAAPGCRWHRPPEPDEATTVAAKLRPAMPPRPGQLHGFTVARRGSPLAMVRASARRRWPTSAASGATPSRAGWRAAARERALSARAVVARPEGHLQRQLQLRSKTCSRAARPSPGRSPRWPPGAPSGQPRMTASISSSPFQGLLAGHAQRAYGRMQRAEPLACSGAGPRCARLVLTSRTPRRGRHQRAFRRSASTCSSWLESRRRAGGVEEGDGCRASAPGRGCFEIPAPR
jgi:hypothetical protein